MGRHFTFDPRPQFTDPQDASLPKAKKEKIKVALEIRPEAVVRADVAADVAASPGLPPGSTTAVCGTCGLPFANLAAHERRCRNRKRPGPATLPSES